MTLYHNFAGAAYTRGSNTDFMDPRHVEFINEGARGGWAVHYGNFGRVGYVWPANQVAELEMRAYQGYVKACVDEDIEAFGLAQWRVQGNPAGPV